MKTNRFLSLAGVRILLGGCLIWGGLLSGGLSAGLRAQASAGGTEVMDGGGAAGGVSPGAESKEFSVPFIRNSSSIMWMRFRRAI